MILGLVSDTHGHVANTRAATRMLGSLEVTQVLHCGDIGSTDIPGLFSAWPTHFVFGNVDGDKRGLQQAIEAAGLTCHGAFAELELLGRRIALLHGDDSRLLADSIRSGQYDLVCHGHTHVAAKTQHGKTWVVNPGALFRANPHTLAVVRLPELEITHIALDTH